MTLRKRRPPKRPVNVRLPVDLYESISAQRRHGETDTDLVTRLLAKASGDLLEDGETLPISDEELERRTVALLVRLALL